MKKRFLLATALLSTLGITGVVRSWVSSPTPRPVAIMHQSQISPAQETMQISPTPVSLDQANDQGQDSLVPQSFQEVSQYSQRISQAAKDNDWQTAEADLLVLRQSAQQLIGRLPSNGSSVRQLATNLEQLQTSVAVKDQQAIEKTADQVALLATQITQQYSPAMLSTVVAK